MKKLMPIPLLVVFLLLAMPAAMTQDAGTSNGPVWRINYIKIKPGKNADYMKWQREYLIPLLAEQKKAGLILDYKTFTKPTGDNSPGDWNMAGATLYRNYAEALDESPERTKKMREISLKIFGSEENLRKLQAELRDPNRDVVASHLVRELIITPAK